MQYQVPGVIAAAAGTITPLQPSKGSPQAPARPSNSCTDANLISSSGQQVDGPDSQHAPALTNVLIHYRFASSTQAMRLLESPQLQAELSDSFHHSLLCFEAAVENDLEKLFMRGPIHAVGWGLLVLFKPQQSASPALETPPSDLGSPQAGPSATVTVPSMRLLGQLAALAATSGAVQVTHGPLAVYKHAGSDRSSSGLKAGATHALLARFSMRGGLLAFANGTVMQRLAQAGSASGSQRGLPLQLLSCTAFDMAGSKQRNVSF